jgi:uncharacterized protein YjbI with pentapeptide repeats
MPERLGIPPEPWTFVTEASDQLLETIVNEGGFTPEAIVTARQLLERLAVSGRLTREPDHRRILRSKLAYWASEIRFETSELVHPPRLLPAGKGSGLPTDKDASRFLADVESERRVNAREVQGARFDGGRKFLTGMNVLNSFLLRCSITKLRLTGDLAIAATSVVGGDLTDLRVAGFKAPNARFLGVTIKELHVSSPPNFERVRMPHTYLDGGSLVEAVFDFANLAGGDDIDASDLPDIEDYGVAREGTGATQFRGVDLRRASFGADAYLQGTTFDNCNLEGATFAGSKLVGTIFRDCDFLGDEFDGARDAVFATVTDSRKTPAPDPRPLTPSADDHPAL